MDATMNNFMEWYKENLRYSINNISALGKLFACKCIENQIFGDLYFSVLCLNCQCHQISIIPKCKCFTETALSEGCQCENGNQGPKL